MPRDNHAPIIETGRETVYSSGGAVVSISHLAASAIAVAAIEAVTVQPACGVGGEPFAIGSAKLIVVDPTTGVKTAGADPRTDGHAAAV